MNFLFLVVLLTVTACNTRPPSTKVFESLDYKALQREARQPLVIRKDTVVLDARSSFNYSLAHVRGSYNLNWREFSRSKSEHPGQMTRDLYKKSRKLALLGIDPDTPVIVLGQGRSGAGDEARLAWTLLYLGVKNVQVARFDYFKSLITHTVNEKPKKNKIAWRPQLKHRVKANKKEVVSALKDPNGGVLLIDVRAAREYTQQKPIKYKMRSYTWHALNINWQEFLNEEGRINFKIKRRLQAIGVKKDKRIIVLSHNGVRSSVGVMALISMGYTNVANYNMGLSDF